VAIPSRFSAPTTTPADAPIRHMLVFTVEGSSTKMSFRVEQERAVFMNAGRNHQGLSSNDWRERFETETNCFAR